MSEAKKQKRSSGILDNTALHHAVQQAKKEKCPVYAVYVVSPTEWKNHDIAPIRIHFWLRNLVVLKEDLEALNISLVVLTANSVAQVPQLIQEASQKLECHSVHWNIEYEVNESKRDATAKTLLQDVSIDCYQHHDQCIVTPGTVLTKEGKTYTIFTPFKKSWIPYIYKNLKFILPSDESLQPCDHKDMSLEAQNYMKAHSSIPSSVSGFDLSKDHAEALKTMYPVGQKVALKILAEFIAKKAQKYQPDRDFPAIQGTSMLSPYLSAGVLSPRECFKSAMKANGDRLDSGNPGLVTWISELCWRDFYKNILVAFPRVCKNKPFKMDTDQLEWLYNDEQFQLWCQGKTGFPIVDAGMRQLNATGWMHNRVRMVTAMFLSKDLLLDWRLGEKYFMQNLIDGDFASNNGGWQWAASTGTDSVPYFRIFNPVLQAERFDKDGAYIRKWVPELAHVKGKAIHAPYERLSKAEFEKLNYVKPIVDHNTARDRCLAAFKTIVGKK